MAPSWAAVATMRPVPLQWKEPRSANLRAGPGTTYAIVGAVAAEEAIEPLGRSEAGDWLLVRAAAGEAWIAAFLVENVDPGGLPSRQSTAPTVTPALEPPAAAPSPAVPTTGPLTCPVECTPGTISTGPVTSTTLVCSRTAALKDPAKAAGAYTAGAIPWSSRADSPPVWSPCI